MPEPSSFYLHLSPFSKGDAALFCGRGCSLVQSTPPESPFAKGDKPSQSQAGKPDEFSLERLPTGAGSPMRARRERVGALVLEGFSHLIRHQNPRTLWPSWRIAQLPQTTQRFPPSLRREPKRSISKSLPLRKGLSGLT